MTVEATLTGVEMIAAARAKHEAKGWTAEHDDTHHQDGELAMAAACYAASERIYVERRPMPDRIVLADPWPFSAHADLAGRGFYDWDKRKHGGANFVQAPETQDRLELLVAAGAMIAAEIDRLQRAALREERHDG